MNSMTRVALCAVVVMVVASTACKAGDTAAGDGGSAGGTPDAGGTFLCTASDECSDGLACTIDTCFDGACRYTIGPSSGPTACPSGQVCVLDEGCVAGKPCWVAGDCTDADGCTSNERCDPASSTCVFDWLDSDGDGHASLVCSGADCNDADEALHPGAADMRGDGVDQDCDGIDGVDLDADGFASLASGGIDCNDSAPAVHPGVPDTAGDGVDQNCDGIDGVTPTDIDVLFVIDNSGSMSEEQEALVGGSFANFLAQLQQLPGGLPNLHVGIVSSNVGTGGFDINGCSGPGDDGGLQSSAHGACQPPQGSYISDLRGAGGTRITNYVGSLTESFSCIAKLGTTGCEFEQHLESMKRALDNSNPENLGFVRPHAWLLVVILADEDDCSVTNSLVFHPSDTSLGPLSSFRCTEFGVQCATPGGPITRSAGTYGACTAQLGSPYIRHPSQFAAFLMSLKGAPSKIIVAAMVGAPTPFNVATGPSLSPSCTSATGSATPAVRFQSFLDVFQGRSFFRAVCSDLPTSFGELGVEVKGILLAP